MPNENLDIKDFLQLKNKITKSIVKNIFKNKIICNKNGEILNEQELLDIVSNKIEKCTGVTISNNIPSQCSKNGVFEGYCKQHYNKYFDKDKLKDKLENKETYDFIYESESESESESIEPKIKKFINDSFYYIDDNFIYLSNLSNTKVGYIKNGEYVLSDDPFLLNTKY
jgi:hypothetical protein